MALPSYKEIVELLKKGATVEAQEQIMALREGSLELQEENLSLKKRVQELEEQLAEKAALSFTDGVYWLVRGDSRDGPFCQRCKDVDGRLVRLTPRQVYHNESWISGASCRQCHHQYRGEFGA